MIEHRPAAGLGKREVELFFQEVRRPDHVGIVDEYDGCETDRCQQGGRRAKQDAEGFERWNPRGRGLAGFTAFTRGILQSPDEDRPEYDSRAAEPVKGRSPAPVVGDPSAQESTDHHAQVERGLMD